MTPREHLASAIEFYQPGLVGAERDAYLDKLIEDMGVALAQHTRAGNFIFKGLSDGQKRPLSIAIAICKKPLVIFLDEPTSGLDAAAAASIMGFLKKIAVHEAIAIVCTIHSPSAAVSNTAFQPTTDVFSSGLLVCGWIIDDSVLHSEGFSQIPSVAGFRSFG